MGGSIVFRGVAAFLALALLLAAAPGFACRRDTFASLSNQAQDGSASWSDIYRRFVETGREQGILNADQLADLFARPLDPPTEALASKEFRDLHDALAAAYRGLDAITREAELEKLRAALVSEIGSNDRTKAMREEEQPARLAYASPIDFVTIVRTPIRPGRSPLILSSRLGHLEVQSGLIDRSGKITPLPILGSKPIRLEPQRSNDLEPPGGDTFLGFKGEGGKAHLWTPSTGKLVALSPSPYKDSFLPAFLEPLRTFVTQVIDWRISADGTVAAIVVQRGPQKFHLSAHDTTSGKRIGLGSFGNGKITNSSLTPDGKTAFLLMDGGTAVRWDIPTNKGTSLSLSVSPTQLPYTSVSTEKITTTIWNGLEKRRWIGVIDFQSGKAEWRYSIPESSVVFDREGTRGIALTSNADGRFQFIRLVDVATGDTVVQGDLSAPAYSVRFSADGKNLLLTGDQGMSVFDIEQWRVSKDPRLLMGNPK